MEKTSYLGTLQGHTLAIPKKHLQAYQQQEAQQSEMIAKELEARAAMWRDDSPKQTKIQKKKVPYTCKAVKVRLPTGKTKDYYSFANGEGEEDGEDSHEIINDAKIIGTVAIIDIKGFIQREGRHDDYVEYWGWSIWNKLGTEDVREILMILGKDPRIKAVVLNISSGGGMVDGTEALANDIYDFLRIYKKKVYASIQGYAMSAAYWIASGADYIYLSENTTIVGSIGTMITIYDDAGFLERMGVREINIYAPLSTEKNAAYEEALGGQFQKMQEYLAAQNNVFVDGVLKGRRKKIGIPADIKAESLTPENAPMQLMGSEYVGKFGISAGLADGVKNLNDVIAIAAEKSATEAPIELLPNTMIVRGSLETNSPGAKADTNKTGQETSEPQELQTLKLTKLKNFTTIC
jgi:capsid assembly protease